jgi:hypothetical protein
LGGDDGSGNSQGPLPAGTEQTPRRPTKRRITCGARPDHLHAARQSIQVRCQASHRNSRCWSTLDAGEERSGRGLLTQTQAPRRRCPSVARQNHLAIHPHGIRTSARDTGISTSNVTIATTTTMTTTFGSLMLWLPTTSAAAIFRDAVPRARTRRCRKRPTAFRRMQGTTRTRWRRRWKTAGVAGGFCARRTVATQAVPRPGRGERTRAESPAPGQASDLLSEQAGTRAGRPPRSRSTSGSNRCSSWTGTCGTESRQQPYSDPRRVRLSVFVRHNHSNGKTNGRIRCIMGTL